MTKMRFIMSMVVVLLTLGVCSADAGVVEGSTCIVIPSRHTVVQFSFDVLRLRRNVYLVAYDKEIGGSSTVMHVWDAKTQDWVRVGVEEYVAGTVFTQTPSRLIVTGARDDLPEELAAAPSWTAEAYQIESLDLVALLNKLQEVFKFNEREWKWLASRYDIKYEDLNAERRKYGKYGKPGEKKAAMPGEVSAPVSPSGESTIEIISAPEPETAVEQPAAEVLPAEEPVEQPAADKAPEDK